VRKWARFWLFLVLILLPASSPAPLAPSARAASPAAPQAAAKPMHGRIHYAERGPGVTYDGFANVMLSGGVGVPVAGARIIKGFQSALSLPLLAGNPSIKQVNEMLRQGVPIDLANLGVKASYSADFDFDLELAKDGSYSLKSGKVTWTSQNNTQIKYEGASITDSFTGSGSETLDATRNFITLTMNTQSKPATFNVDFKLEHPMATKGRSDWVIADGAMKMWIEDDGTTQTTGAYVVGAPVDAPMVEPSSPATKPVAYYGKGTMKSGIVRGYETYRTIMDAQAVIEYGISANCDAEIDMPAPNSDYVLNGDNPAVIESRAIVGVKPSAFGDDARWKLPELAGPAKMTPENGKGWSLLWRYEGLPEKNSSFGKREFKVQFDELAGICPDPKPQPVRFFFTRDAENNPEGLTPNWFYYWSQTRAGMGLGSRILYAELLPGECDGKILGFYLGFNKLDQRDKIYICNLKPFNFYRTNAVTLRVTEGIDVFGSVVLHEWTHNLNAKDWWPKGIPRNLCYPKMTAACPDKDDDYVPDNREAAYGLSPLTHDTLGLGFDDLEYPAYLQDNTWPNGSANREDWAVPGKQKAGVD
jgi:hypothetical protein